MNIQAIVFSVAITLLSGASLAGAGHDHGHSHEPVNQQQAEQAATRVVSTLAERGVIDKSWTTSQVDRSERKTFGGQPEWVVSYKNDAVSDPEKRTLYIFLTPAGEYIAANYTGK